MDNKMVCEFCRDILGVVDSGEIKYDNNNGEFEDNKSLVGIFFSHLRCWEDCS